MTTGRWTRDVGRAHRVSNRIGTAMARVNTCSCLREPTPSGGFKAGGRGREIGFDARAPYLETRPPRDQHDGPVSKPARALNRLMR
ncbi:aldehyde dehydrogenase family protein [Burkholderia puraquae]|uniref:aldehyde dehydrogenase family protein n=1 Tax=Burkholderia puraquae TaxID=1904757 RepID=UPI001FCAE25D|nr:aldehyde dehydrogenase family protein [Burkholderia puraquae]